VIVLREPLHTGRYSTAFFLLDDRLHERCLEAATSVWVAAGE
jgi:hypothetical protein